MKLRLTQIGPRKMEVISEKWSFVIDLNGKFGGEDSGPNPSELTAAAVASCEALTRVIWAERRHQIDLRGLEAEVEWEYGTKPNRVSRIDVAMRDVGPQLGDDNIRAFTAMAKGCIISKTLQDPPQLSLRVE